MWARVAVVLCCASCATSESIRQGPVTKPDYTPAAGTSNEELATAWTREAPRPTPAPPDRPVFAPKADRREAFKKARDEGRAALKAHQLDDARRLASDAVEAAKVLHGRERQEAGYLAFTVEREAGDLAAAQAAALSWRRSCGPEELEGCRARALAGLSLLKSAAATATAARLREAEACLAGPEPLGCTGRVDRIATAVQDEVLAGRAGLVRALAEKDEERRIVALVHLDEKCVAPGCVAVRHRALNAAASLASARGDFTAAARALIRDGLVTASTVEPELRPWVRATGLDEICAKLDAAEGAGTCRRIEKLVAGTWSFRDFSRKKGGTGLTVAEVRTVNQHYAPLLEECLADEARRMEPPDARQYDVSWTVHNDGRVYDAHLRADLDATPLADCLKQQFSTWRYPRFDGEFQNVQQTFTVTASTRSVIAR